MWWLVTKAALTNGNSGFVSRVQIRAWKLWSQIIWPRVTIASANTRWAKDALARIHECPRISTQNVAETPQVDYSSILRTHGIRRHFGRRVWKKMKKIKSRRMPFQQLSSITKLIFIDQANSYPNSVFEIPILDSTLYTMAAVQVRKPPSLPLPSL